MATLTIRKLDDEVYERLRVHAKRNNRSIEAEARHVLGENVALKDTERSANIEALIQRLDQNAMSMPRGMDSVALIRAVRDEA